jgi:hypothetical protein
MLGQRAVQEPEAPDERTVIEAFPRNVTSDAPGRDPLGEDILRILQRSHDRVSAEAGQATAVASAAMNRVDEVASGLPALTQRLADAEAKTQRVGETVIAALNETSGAKVAARQAVAAASLGVIQRLGDSLTSLASYAIDRAPAFLSLGAAVWLWGNVLADPKPLQLVGLGLFGAVVVAPAVWLSSRKP